MPTDARPDKPLPEDCLEYSDDRGFIRHRPVEKTGFWYDAHCGVRCIPTPSGLTEDYLMSWVEACPTCFPR